MKGKNLRNFFLSIILPSILSIFLFIASVYFYLIPAFQKNIMDRKKEMISELTTTAWSLVKEYYDDFQNGLISEDSAKMLAAAKVERMRYGEEKKDYFWITDMKPVMIMHPYRKDLNSKDLSDYKDPNGTKLFVEALKVVKDSGQGYIHYMWQWKDDTTRIVPKLSFVKEFKNWQWIIGTGIYLEDVKQEIRSIKNRLLRISLIITFLIILLLAYIIRQSLLLETRRKSAEEKVRISKEKYKSLVQASEDGTLMILENKIVFSNQKFNKLIGLSAVEVLSLDLNSIFDTSWKELIQNFAIPEKTASMETKLKCQAGDEKDVVINISGIHFEKQDGFIVTIKEILPARLYEKELSRISDDLQTSLHLMNQPIRYFIREAVTCPSAFTVAQAAALMTRFNSDSVFITLDNKITGIITDADLRKRILSRDLPAATKVSEIMTSPVEYISDSALLYEAIHQFNTLNISHLAVKDSHGNISGVISDKEIHEMQGNTLSFMIREIEAANRLEQLKWIVAKIPVLIRALIESGDKVQNVTRINTAVTDAITQKLISFAIEKNGVPPCQFTFVAMGSEGRMEQTLATDQDNAIIFEDCPDHEISSRSEYFLKLGDFVSERLSLLGYKYCDGGYMASNPMWVKPLQAWKELFTEWIENSDPQSLLQTSILFDFRSIYGDESLAAELRKQVNTVSDNKAVFFQHLAMTVTKFRSPLSIFGNILGEPDSGDEQIIDLKKILLPVTSFIRLYALKNKIPETNSQARLSRLQETNSISKTLFDELTVAYNYLTTMRFRFQILSIVQNETPNNRVNIKHLTDIEKTTLKKILSLVGELQAKLNFDFKGTV